MSYCLNFLAGLLALLNFISFFFASYSLLVLMSTSWLPCYTSIAIELIGKLKARFRHHRILDVHGIVYPLFRLVASAEENFWKRLAVLKKWYCEHKTLMMEKRGVMSLPC
jgi:hypothetical protein